MTIRAALPVMAVPALLLSLAACSSGADSKEASPQDDHSRVSDPRLTAFDWDVAFAECMRAEGIDYDDPDPSGKLEALEVDDYDKYNAAQAHCEVAVEGDLGKRPIDEAAREKNQKEADAFEKVQDCLRKDGYEVEEGRTYRDIPESAYKKCGFRPAGGDE